jgi:hypothetical protein
LHAATSGYVARRLPGNMDGEREFRLSLASVMSQGVLVQTSSNRPVHGVRFVLRS